MIPEHLNDATHRDPTGSVRVGQTCQLLPELCENGDASVHGRELLARDLMCGRAVLRRGLHQRHQFGDIVKPEAQFPRVTQEGEPFERGFVVAPLSAFGRGATGSGPHSRNSGSSSPSLPYGATSARWSNPSSSALEATVAVGRFYPETTRIAKEPPPWATTPPSCRSRGRRPPGLRRHRGQPGADGRTSRRRDRLRLARVDRGCAAQFLGCDLSRHRFRSAQDRAAAPRC